MSATITMVTREDIDRMMSSVGGGRGNCPAKAPVPSKREHLKQMSDSRVTGWTDTLAAKRKAKLDWKADKARQDEEHRKVQDAKDAARHQRVRMVNLSNADKLIREQTEKVRQFRSQQMLVDTLDTRDGQMEEKKAQRKSEKAMEELWHLAVMDNLQKAEEKSRKETEAEKKRSLDLAEDLRRQREERQERIQLQQHAKREEEVLMIRKISEDEAKKEKLEIQLKNERRNNVKLEMEKNEELLRMRQEEAQRLETERARKCEEEAAERNRINKARADLELKHFEEKQAMKKFLSDRASEELKQRSMRECEIFERDVKNMQERERRKEEAARKKVEQERADIDKSRRRQLQAKAKDVEAERELGELYAKELARITSQKQDLERRKELDRRKGNIQLREQQRQQIVANEAAQRAKNASALAEEKEIMQKFSHEDELFKQFVHAEIESYRAAGKRTALLERTTLRV